MGRISYQKGYDILLKIWQQVQKKHSGWHLHIYGAGDTALYRSLSKELGIENNITFFKPVNDLEKVYNKASMLLNTSRYEPFGLANIEALFHGLPVLAFSNTLGPRSYIQNDVNGFLIEEGDIKGYAKKISWLIQNPSEISRIGENAKVSVEKYNIDTVMKQWYQLFQSI